jgi:hypothetical protein
MKALRHVAALLLILAVVAPFLAEERKAADADEGFVPMFNGKDLSGWVNVNCAPSTFFVKDGEVITTGKPTGYLRTAKQYENFIADFEWMHINKTEVGNSGFFVWADPLPGVGTPYTRGIEVQVLVNLEKEGFYTSQGDLFSIHGAHCKPDRPHPHGWERCLPCENRCKGGGEWNHYKVIAKDGTIKLHVNGKEVSGLSECRPRKGYLALESEGAECHFRRLKIKELPSSNPKPNEVADVALDFKQLFMGLDLTGWKADEETKKHWQPRDWLLHYDGHATSAELATEREFPDAELIVDFRYPKKGAEAGCDFIVHKSEKGSAEVSLGADGQVYPGMHITQDGARKGVATGSSDPLKPLKPTGEWNRLRATLQGGKLSATVNGKDIGEVSMESFPARGRFVLRPKGEMEFGNLFVCELNK